MESSLTAFALITITESPGSTPEADQPLRCQNVKGQGDKTKEA